MDVTDWMCSPFVEWRTDTARSGKKSQERSVSQEIVSEYLQIIYIYVSKRRMRILSSGDKYYGLH